MIESQRITRTTDIFKTVGFYKKATFTSDCVHAEPPKHVS
ncbi:hypothetical protein T06_9412 [Trichinella sp. T6]|nr:hypothetical protein T06_9412 [Trichinella sp. T6]